RSDYDVVAERPESVVSGRSLTRGPEPAKVLGRPRVTPDKLLERVFPPMLATLIGAPPPDEASWQLEGKYDGFRAPARLAGRRVPLLSRNGLDLAGRFPDVARALAEITVGDAVLDGEIAARDAGGRTRFELLGHERGAGLMYY